MTTHHGFFKRASLVAAMLVTGEARAETYQLVEPESFLYVEVRPAKGLFSKAAHPHVIRASKWTGTVEWDPAAPEKCAIKIDIPVDQLVVADGVISVASDSSKKITYGELVGGKRFNVTLTGNNIDQTSGKAPLKTVQQQAESIGTGQ